MTENASYQPTEQELIRTLTQNDYLVSKYAKDDLHGNLHPSRASDYILARQRVQGATDVVLSMETQGLLTQIKVIEEGNETRLQFPHSRGGYIQKINVPFVGPKTPEKLKK